MCRHWSKFVLHLSTSIPIWSDQAITSLSGSSYQGTPNNCQSAQNSWCWLYNTKGKPTNPQFAQQSVSPRWGQANHQFVVHSCSNTERTHEPIRYLSCAVCFHASMWSNQTDSIYVTQTNRTHLKFFCATMKSIRASSSGSVHFNCANRKTLSNNNANLSVSLLVQVSGAYTGNNSRLMMYVPPPYIYIYLTSPPSLCLFLSLTHTLLHL